MRPLIYAKGLFDLQITFAMRVQALSGLPLEQVLLEWTNLYVRLGLGRHFDPGDATWQTFLAGLRGAADPGAWAHRFYLHDPERTTAPDLAGTVGCFSYALRADCVRLHFRNAEPDGRSPLGRDRIAQRRKELRTLFEQARPHVPGEMPVVGASWLYNLEAYRRLFPPDYVSTARVLRDRFQSMPLWGQFVDRRGELRPPSASAFLDAVARCTRVEALGECFPLQVLTVHAPAAVFYDGSWG